MYANMQNTHVKYVQDSNLRIQVLRRVTQFELIYTVFAQLFKLSTSTIEKTIKHKNQPIKHVMRNIYNMQSLHDHGHLWLCVCVFK